MQGVCVDASASCRAELNCASYNRTIWRKSSEYVTLLAKVTASRWMESVAKEAEAAVKAVSSSSEGSLYWLKGASPNGALLSPAGLLSFGARKRIWPKSCSTANIRYAKDSAILTNFSGKKRYKCSNRSETHSKILLWSNRDWCCLGA